MATSNSGGLHIDFGSTQEQRRRDSDQQKRNPLLYDERIHPLNSTFDMNMDDDAWVSATQARPALHDYHSFPELAYDQSTSQEQLASMLPDLFPESHHYIPTNWWHNNVEEDPVMDVDYDVYRSPYSTIIDDLETPSLVDDRQLAQTPAIKSAVMSPVLQSPAQLPSQFQSHPIVVPTSFPDTELLFTKPTEPSTSLHIVTADDLLVDIPEPSPSKVERKTTIKSREDAEAYSESGSPSLSHYSCSEEESSTPTRRKAPGGRRKRPSKGKKVKAPAEDADGMKQLAATLMCEGKCTYRSPYDGWQCQQLSSRPWDVPRHLERHIKEEYMLVMKGMLSPEKAKLSELITKDKLYICWGCQKDFAREDALNRHIKNSKNGNHARERGLGFRKLGDPLDPHPGVVAPELWDKHRELLLANRAAAVEKGLAPRKVLNQEIDTFMSHVAM